MAAAEPEGPLHRRVAEHVTGLVQAGTLRPGDRLPSVRRLGEQLGVSVTTVVAAYRRLEDARIIEARPRSGHYVRAVLQGAPQPEKTATEARATPVTCRPLVLRILEQASRPDVVGLGAAVPSPSLFPAARIAAVLARTVREDPQGTLTYGAAQGEAALRIQVARRLLDAGCAAGPDEVVVTSGTQDAVHLALRAVTRPGDTVVVESPTYYGLLEAIGSLHLKALEVATDPRDGICLEDLDAVLSKRRVAACVLGPSYGNPLGHCMPDRAKRDLVDLARAHGVALIEDDVYGDLTHGASRPKALRAFDPEGRVLLCSSFSKTLASGYRVGWLVPGPLLDRVLLLKFSSTVAAPTPTQRALAAFLESGGFDRHLRGLRRLHRELVERMTGAVVEFFPEGTAVTRPQGGHLLWVALPEDVDSLELHERALADGVSIAPGPIFSPTQRYGSFVRLNCALPWTGRVEEAVRRLGRLVADMAGSGRPRAPR